jgi:transposase
LPDVRVQDVAESLYIHPFMLSRWRKQAREGLIMTKGVQVDKDVAWADHLDAKRQPLKRAA